MLNPSPTPSDVPGDTFRKTFLEMFEESFGNAIAYAHSILKDRHLAEDVVSETVVACLNTWWKCRVRTKKGMAAFFFIHLKSACLQKLRDQQGRGRHRRVIVPFDEAIAAPGWEEQNAACSPADLLGDRDYVAEKLRVLKLLLSLLPANYQAALWERSQDKPPSGYIYNNVEFFRAKKALVKLLRLYQETSRILEDCPHRLGLNQLSTASQAVMQTWLVETGSTAPKADSPWRLYASDPKWIAFRASIHAFKPTHRIPILIDLIPGFHARNS